MDPAEQHHVERLLEVARGGVFGDRSAWLSSWSEALGRLLDVRVSVFDPETRTELAAWPSASPMAWDTKQPPCSTWSTIVGGTLRRRVGSLWVGLAPRGSLPSSLESAESWIGSLAEALWLEEAPPPPTLLVFSQRGRQLSGPPLSSLGVLAMGARQALSEAAEKRAPGRRVLTPPDGPAQLLRVFPDGDRWLVQLTELDDRNLAAREVVHALLTPAQLKVARLVAEGLPNRRIAESLAISSETVKAHLKAVMGKLGATTRVELGRWF